MRNISAKADNVGDTLPASDFNANLRSELQNAVQSADFTLDPEGGPDTDVEMLGKTLALYANAAQYYQDSGAANAYVLARVGNLKALTAYKDGVIVYFKAGNDNTGASTINVDSLGSKDLVDFQGNALVGGEIITGGYVIARYRNSTDDFEIIKANNTADMPIPASADAFRNIQVNGDGDGYQLFGPLVAYKNKIINGNFDIWQRATSQTSNNYGSDDRWNNTHELSTKTHSRQAFTIGQSDVPGNPRYYSRTVVTTAGSAAARTMKQQAIERVETLAGETVTVSFYAKADSVLNLALDLVQSFGLGGSAAVQGIGTKKFTLSTSWAKYTQTVTLPSVSGKTLSGLDDDGLLLRLWFDAGSDWNSITDSLGNQSGTFDIARVQLEPGPTATNFDERALMTEWDLCQRYYEKNTNTYNLCTFVNTGAFINYRVGNIQYRVVKNKVPSITLLAPTTSPSIISTSIYGFRPYQDIGSSFDESYFTGYTADSEL